MLALRGHPGLDQLSDFLAGASGASRQRIAEHLERCVDCRRSLQFLRDVSAGATALPSHGPPPELRTRVLASRASGRRAILPVHDAVTPRRRWFWPAVAAVLLSIVVGTQVIRRPSVIEAGTTSGTLTFMPAQPQAGQRISVSYRSSAQLSGQPSLSLRARLRSASDESYQAIPIVTVATLRAGAKGEFAGSFTLPDSIVYAAFAVEDRDAGTVDDNGSRAWELLVSDSAGRPLFAALDQRANDMMGRNWEEGFATAQRMVTLYPDSLRAWSWLRAFHGWLGRADDDSIRALHRARLAAFDSVLANGKALSSQDEGRIAWYARSVDSSLAEKWRSRLLRDAPTNTFAVQWRMVGMLDSLRVSHDTARTLRQLDRLWAEAPRDRLAQVANYGVSLAFESGDTTLIERWTTRLAGSDRNRNAVARWIATKFVDVPSLRDEGIRRLRHQLDSIATRPSDDRALGETMAEQRERQDRLRRRLLATLGKALVADGRVAEARELLTSAAASGWDASVFRAVRAASLAAGDTSAALTMAARMIVDPRTTAAFADSVRPVAAARLGEAGWRHQLDSARTLFAERMLSGASVRSLARGARVRGLDGKVQELRGLTRGRVAVVAFWSRFCGPAIEDLPHLNEVAARLARVDIPVVNIVDEAKSSPELQAFVREKRVTGPVYLDSWHEASRAFNQWGTPYYYVLDADGRIRFDVTSSADEALARAEALRLMASSAPVSAP